jgi:hypothetical protein
MFRTNKFLLFIFTAFAFSACVHEYIPEEKPSWNIRAELSFADAQYWPSGQQIRLGAFAADDTKNPVASIGIEKPASGKTEVAIGAVPQGTYLLKVYVTENTVYKADVVGLGDFAVNSDLAVTKSEIKLVTFSRVQQQILNSCILCHGGSSGELAANLNLMPGKSYAQLVGVQAYKNTSFLRVNAGSGNYSYLYKVLNKDIDFDHAASSSATSADKQLIFDWINDGAKNN